MATEDFHGFTVRKGGASMNEPFVETDCLYDLKPGDVCKGYRAQWKAGIDVPTVQYKEGIWSHRIECYGTSEEDATGFRDKVLEVISNSSQSDTRILLLDSALRDAIDRLEREGITGIKTLKRILEDYGIGKTLE